MDLKRIYIGKKIKEFRKNKKITQSEIAQMLNISRVSYIQYENGKRDIPFSLLPEICEILEIKISDLDSLFQYSDLDFQIFDFTERYEVFLKEYTIQLKDKILSQNHIFLLKEIFRNGIYLEISNKKITIPKTSINTEKMILNIDVFYNNIEFITDSDRLIKDFLYLSIFLK